MAGKDEESGIERMRRKLEEQIRESVPNVSAQEDLISAFDLFEEECKMTGFIEGFAAAKKDR